MLNDKPVIIVGAGNHAKVILDILLENGTNVIGLVDKNVSKNTFIYEIPVLGDDEEIFKYNPNDICLANGIGSTGDLMLRKKVYDFFKEKGYIFTSIVHSFTHISKRSHLSEGVQILPGVVINNDVNIGTNTIINSNSTIEHGCIIGNNVHIAPGCTLCGDVSVGDETHVGTGSSIIQGINIGKRVLIGAGSVVIRNIENNSKVYGVPAKIYE